MRCRVLLSLALADSASAQARAYGGSVGSDLTVGGCLCREFWSVSDGTCADGDLSYQGCGMATPCDGEDGDRGYTWCYIQEPRPGCLPEAANWDWCLPGVLNYSDPPPTPCADQNLLAFDCPERVAMFVGVLVSVCVRARA
eukprot:COSAG03_NODE_2563_length_2639_cov_23.543701_2_plen_141_part_00